MRTGTNVTGEIISNFKKRLIKQGQVLNYQVGRDKTTEEIPVLFISINMLYFYKIT